jgi:signal transduction histidine kinase
MEFVNFPIVALAAALICLIGMTIYALTQRGALRSKDEQLVVARAQSYAMLELSQAGVLFLDREHKLMGEASAAAPELLGHTCGTGTAFVQVVADLVPINVRRDAVAYLESMWKAEPTAVVDATQNPLQRIHSGSRHLAIRFSRLVVDGRVHHIIVSVERISAPRLVPHTIEVPSLDEETFARRLAGETGARLATLGEAAPGSALEAGTAEHAMITSRPGVAAAPVPKPPQMPMLAPLPGEFDLGPLDVTADKLAAPPKEALDTSLPTNHSGAPLQGVEIDRHMATTISNSQSWASPEAMGGERTFDAPLRNPDASIIDPPDPRLSEVLKEIMHVDAAKLEHFLSDARDKAGQLRAIMKLPAREPQAFREKLVLILELIRGINARAERLPLPSVCERASKFEAALSKLRDKHSLSGNDFLPLAVKLDDLLSHLAIQGEVVGRLSEWHTQNGNSSDRGTEATQRSTTITRTTIRQPKLSSPSDTGMLASQGGAATQKTARLSDLSQESLEEMATFLADMYSKRVSLVVVGLEDVPGNYRRIVEKILGQLIHNAIRHGVETPADRVVDELAENGTVAVQFQRVGADGYQLSVQDDGRGLDHDKIRAEAVRQGVMTQEAATKVDPRKLASLIFRPGFTTVGEGGARGIGMDVVRDLVNKAGGRVGIATKPGEYTRFRVSLPYEKKNSNAAVA